MSCNIDKNVSFPFQIGTRSWSRSVYLSSEAISMQFESKMTFTGTMVAGIHSIGWILGERNPRLFRIFWIDSVTMQTQTAPTATVTNHNALNIQRWINRTAERSIYFPFSIWVCFYCEFTIFWLYCACLASYFGCAHTTNCQYFWSISMEVLEILSI